MKNIILLFLIFIAHMGWGQEDYYASQSRFMQKTNPSYFGVNNLNKVGVLYNSLSLGQNSSSDNKYFFGVISFDDKKFSLGFDVNSLKITSTNLTISSFKISYIYKIQLTNNTYFLPGVSMGIGNTQVNKEALIFEDQLNATSGFINTETIDPLGDLLGNANYFDFGVSFLIHNQNYILGLSLKHLNRPNTSLNKEREYNKPLSLSLQGGKEFDINPFERSFLPRYSYLFTYGSVSKIENNLYLNFIQEARLGEFSLGFNQKISNVGGFNFNSLGAAIGIQFENFEFGLAYNFPFRKQARVFAPSIFELFVTFDFSKFRKNQRGFFKHLQIENY